jgi:hypothetical protein
MTLWREPMSTIGALWFFATIMPRLIIHAILIASREKR